MSGLVNGVLAGTGAFLSFATALTCERRVATEGFFQGRFARTKPIQPHFGMVSVAFGILGRG
jgi:hypothetical protein